MLARVVLSLLVGLSACSGPEVISQRVDLPAAGQGELKTVVSDYLPALRPGQQWHYRLSSGDRVQLLDYEIVSVGTEIVQKAVLRQLDGTQIGEALMTLNAYGVPQADSQRLSQSLSFGGGLAGPRTSLQQSVEASGQVEVHQSVSGPGGTASQSIAPLDFAFVGRVQVQVPAGTFQADQYVARDDGSHPSLQISQWLVHGIGEVKRSQQLADTPGVTGLLESRELTGTAGLAG